ncbi:MAG: PIG-L family deacetylase [Bryobacterales bacterium]
MARMFAAAAALLLALSHLSAQPTPRIGAAELEDSLDRLNTLGSVLMMAAHPDDENTAVLSYFARGRHMRTAYLAATRGEGGQNLIGTEQGALLGLIRTQELLAARRIDGAQQFFSRAIDFGYSKFPEEALEQWGRERLLADMVRVIRKYRPDVIIARFPPPPGDGGHGQHTAVGHLGPVAFEAAADPNQFPELGPAWQAKRYYWNVFNFGRRPGDPLEQKPGRLTLEIGDYDPVLGKSYSEIAGESRSMHASQGMGAAQNKGEQKAQFDFVVGDRATEDLFDGIDTSWGRVPDGERVGELLDKARREYNPNHPERIVPVLFEAWKQLEPMDGFWPNEKRAELLHAIELASGLWLDAKTAKWDFTPGETAPVEPHARQSLEDASD